MLSDATRKLLENAETLDPKKLVKLLQQRSAELEEDLMAIRAHQNRHALPNVLPTEILEQILMEYVKDIHWNWKVEDKLVWVRVMQVCRRWREVALNCAPLWSTLHISHPEFMNLMLARSKGVLLNIRLSTDDFKRLRFPKAWDRCEALTEILSHVERFRTLALHMDNDGIACMEHLLSKATGSTPLLENLHLSNSKLQSSFPPDFLQGGTPALQNLSLLRVAITWNRIPLSTSLTQLALEHGGPRPSLDTFYKSFSRLDRLRALTLKNWLPYIDPVDPSGTLAPLTLRSLKTLEVTDFAEEFYQFFELIRVPVVSSTKVSISGRQPLGPSVSECLGRLRGAISGAMENYRPDFTVFMNSFDARDRPHREPTIAIYFDPLVMKMDGRDFLSGPLIQITFAHHAFPAPDILISATVHFNLVYAFHIVLTRCTLLPANLFVDLFCCSPKLSRLTFTETPTYQIFHKMKEDSALLTKRKSSRRLSHKPYFPALTSISLSYGTSFDDGGTVPIRDMMAAITFALNKRPRAYFVPQLELHTYENLAEADIEIFYRWLSPSINVFWNEPFN